VYVFSDGPARSRAARVSPRLLGAFLIAMTMLAPVLPPSAPVQAATTRTVTSAADSGPGTLREAIGLSIDGDTIDFSPTLDNVPIVVGATGTLEINKNITVQGRGADKTIIDGQNARNVLRISFKQSGASCISVGQTVNVTISGVTIRNGASTSGAAFAEGVGVTVGCNISNTATLSMSDSVVQNNLMAAGAGTTQGGGFFIVNSTVNLTNVLVDGNHAEGNGGGIHLESGSLIIANSTISNNSSNGFQGGGGIYHASVSGPVSLTNVTVSSNHARTGANGVGGGGFVQAGSANSTITHSTIAFNNGGGAGAGVLARGGTVTLTNSLVAKNTNLGANAISNCGTVSGGVIVGSGANMSDDGTCPSFYQRGSLAQSRPGRQCTEPSGGRCWDADPFARATRQ
jgi:predicted outer membrane repeat protein